MKKFQKINTVYKRDPDNHYVIQPGSYSVPVFKMMKNVNFVLQEKIDGRNHRILWDGNEIEHRGKSDSAHMPDHLMRDIGDVVEPHKMQHVFGSTDVCLYGEAYGPKIQGGEGYCIDGRHRFCLFDIRIGDYWLEMRKVRNIADQLSLDVVHEFRTATFETAAQILKRGVDNNAGVLPSHMIKSRLPAATNDQYIEGFIFRPPQQIFDREGNRVLSKLKYSDFQKLAQV